MAKKKKKKRYEATEQLEIGRGHHEEGADRFIHSITKCEPGWFAVFAACKECDTERRSEPIVFWAVVHWFNGGSGVCGLIQNAGAFVEAPIDHAFVGYAKPGEDIDDVIELAINLH